MAFGYFNPSKGEKPRSSQETPESIAAKREIARALLGQAIGSAPRNIGEGLSAIGAALAYRGTMKRADTAEATARSASQGRNLDLIARALSGGKGRPAIPDSTLQEPPQPQPMGGAPYGPAPGVPMQTPQEWSPELAEGAINRSNTEPAQDEFVGTMWPMAVEASKETGLDPRLIVAQSALETGWGQSAPGNNYFGIKSHGAPGGQTLPTQEVRDGQTVAENASFRTYGSPAESVRDYTDFLTSNPRYQPVLQAQGLDNQIRALGESGYATDPNYAGKVAQIAYSLDVPGQDYGRPTASMTAGHDQQMAQGPAATMTDAAPQPDPQMIEGMLGVLNDPWASEANKALAANWLEQTMAQRQPMSPGDRYKVVGGRLVDLAAQGGPGVVIDAADDPSALDEKIQTLMGTGLDQTTAANIATGRYATSRDPFNGTAQIIDKATGQVVGQLPQQGAAQPPRPTGALSPEAGGPGQAGNAGFGVPDETLYERAAEATGVMPTLREWSTDIPGQLPGELGEAFQFPETVEDRQAFRTAAGKMFRAMSVNPKMPVAEINRIREQFKIEPGMWTSSEGLRARMRSIAGSLETTIQEQRALAADPSMPAEARKSAAENAAAIQDFLREMGVPEGGPASGGGGQSGESGWQQTPGGVRYRIEE